MPGRGHRWYGAWCCRLLVLAGGLLMAACASVKPIHKDYCLAQAPASGATTVASPSSSKDACVDMSHVSEAAKTINDKADEIEKRRGWNERIGQSLDIATFALGAAFALKATHGTKISNGAKNLAFGAGAAYVGGNLFAPGAANTIYGAEDAALVCLSGQGYDLLDLYDGAKKQLAIAYQVDGDCQSDSGISDLEKSLGLGSAAVARLAASDAAISGKLTNAANAAISTAASGINNLQSQAAFLRAGTDIALISGDLVAQAGTPAKPMAAARAKDAQCRAEVAMANANIEARTQAITTAINAVDGAITACVTQTPVTVAPLAVDPGSLAITGNDTRVVKVTGGAPHDDPRYLLTWDRAPGSKTSASIDANGILSIRNESGATKGIYKLTVKDQSTIPLTKDITVDVQ